MRNPRERGIENESKFAKVVRKLWKWSFPLRISSVNVTESAVNKQVILPGEIINGRLHFCAVKLLQYGACSSVSSWDAITNKHCDKDALESIFLHIDGVFTDVFNDLQD